MAENDKNAAPMLERLHVHLRWAAYTLSKNANTLTHSQQCMWSLADIQCGSKMQAATKLSKNCVKSY